MHHRGLAALIAALLVSLGGVCQPSAAREAVVSSTEVVAGGLSFAANASIRIEQQDVLITPDKISITYALRNSASSRQSIYVSFAMPDLDANAVADGDIALAANDPVNFVQFATLVDGQPITISGEQRATALGLDVTNLLSVSGIPLVPATDRWSANLEAMTPAQRLELLERGILKEEGANLAPAWSVRTVAYWRQTFAPEQTITIQHSYRPIAGISSYSADAISASRKRSCVSAAHETAIAKLTSTSGDAPTLTSITYGATPNADALGPIRRFRLIIESTDAQTVIASCREGLKQAGPMQLDWNATDYVPDEDFQLLFAR